MTQAERDEIDRLILASKVLDLETPPDWFHERQLDAWVSTEEILLLLAGRQSGKTSFWPWWLAREIQRMGPGDYGFNGPSFELLAKKALPGFREVFEKQLKLGTYNQGDRIFKFSEDGIRRMFGTTDKAKLLERFGWRMEDGSIMDPEFSVQVSVFAGYASKPESLESATFKAVVSDEAGQDDFKLESYEALQGRRARYRGRHCIVTTPYNLGWLKTKLYDAWQKGAAWIKVISFESWMNPVFGVDQFEKIRKSGLADWKFDMFYRGRFTKPAGLIYDTFEPKFDCVKRFRIPDDWPRFIGVDFGPINCAGVKFAVDPESDPNDPLIYIYKAYHAGAGKSTEEHVATLTRNEPWVPEAVGGSGTEDGWRNDFGHCGLHILKPRVPGVSDGIQAVYGLFKRGRLKVFDDLEKVIWELQNYSYEIDENGDPNPDKIKDKASFHRADAARYALSEFVHNLSFARTVESSDYAESLAMVDLGTFAPH